MTYPSGTSLLYSSLDTSNTSFKSSAVFCASSLDIPTNSGSSTSAGLVIFKYANVPPKLIANNNINPISVLKTLCLFINATNLLFFFPLFWLSSSTTFPYRSVLIFCVLAVAS